MKVILEAKVNGKWQNVATVDAGESKEFRFVLRGLFGLKITLIGRLRFEKV